MKINFSFECNGTGIKNLAKTLEHKTDIFLANFDDNKDRVIKNLSRDIKYRLYRIKNKF